MPLVRLHESHGCFLRLDVTVPGTVPGAAQAEHRGIVVGLSAHLVQGIVDI